MYKFDENDDDEQLMKLTERQFLCCYPIGTYLVVGVEQHLLSKRIKEKIITSDGSYWERTYPKTGINYRFIPGCPHGTGGYKIVRCEGRPWNIHTLVMLAFVQRFEPTTLWCDHINRNKHDNRLSNLRLVTPQENAKNRDNGSFSTRKVFEIIATHATLGLRVFNSQSHAARELNISQCSIALCLSPLATNKTSHGWSFKRGNETTTKRRHKQCTRSRPRSDGTFYTESDIAIIRGLKGKMNGREVVEKYGFSKSFIYRVWAAM